MLLYKYFYPVRIDVLQTLKIRFSQPAIYNDPFELNPIRTSSITEEEFTSIMPILIKFYEDSQDVIDGFKRITYKDFHADPQQVLKLIQQLMASGSLALCLTEVPDNLLMWAHYAFFHKGFVVAFETEHEFFTCLKGEYYPSRIRYQATRPTVTLPRPNPVETYFTKSLEWVYEKEWRLFRGLPKLHSEDQVMERDIDGFPVYLFDFPGIVIKEIILGCRSNLSLKKSVIKIVEEKLTHVSVKEAILSENAYELIFRPIQ